MEKLQCLHLDDWEHCEDLFNDPVGKQNFMWGSPKSKNIGYKIEHPIFSSDQKWKDLKYLILTNFQSLKVWNKVYFYKNLSDSL